MRDLLWLWIAISNHRGVDTKASYDCCNLHWVEAAFGGFRGNFRFFPSLFLFLLLEARHLKIRKLNSILFSRELRRSPGSVQSLIRVWLFAIPWTEACQASLICPLSWLWHLTILSSVVPFPSCLQSFPASGSFPMSQFFASGGQSIGVSASAASHQACP